MIKSFGGNAVRPHAQPWCKYYYDMADEMGIMVLAEDGLFGSSIRPNLTQDETWQRTAAQIERLVKRYRNNPSVVGWSVGNEMFAMSLKHLQLKNFEKFGYKQTGIIESPIRGGSGNVEYLGRFVAVKK